MPLSRDGRRIARTAEGGSAIRHAANVITSLRILFAAAMLCVPPFSCAFWICYACAGVSDMLDGVAARRLKQQSELGARLDSAADLVFACAIAAVMIRHVEMPLWLWLCIAAIALIKLAGYAIGYCKYRTFSALHTYANKAAGGLIFAFPLLYAVLGVRTSGMLLCAVALYAAVEEAVITIRSKELDRNRSSMFFRHT